MSRDIEGGLIGALIAPTGSRGRARAVRLSGSPPKTGSGLTSHPSRVPADAKLMAAAIAAGVLLAIDLPHPSNYGAEADRVLYTLIGVAIAVLVMLPGTCSPSEPPKRRHMRRHAPRERDGRSAPVTTHQLQGGP